MAVVSEVKERGRALVADRPISAGEVVLTDQPALLLPDDNCLSSFCFTCLQGIPAGVLTSVKAPSHSIHGGGSLMYTTRSFGKSQKVI